RRIDRAHPQPPLANALSAGESIGKEIVEDGPGDPDQEQGGTKRVTDRGQDCTGDQRNPADETVEELAEQATGSGGQLQVDRRGVRHVNLSRRAMRRQGPLAWREAPGCKPQSRPSQSGRWER